MAVAGADVGRLREALVWRTGAGVLAGLAGGLVFGALMHVTGAMSAVARLVEGDTYFVGWAVHMAIASFVGITFGLLFGAAAGAPVLSIVLATAYGWVWWVLGGLTLMPLRLGMGLFVFNADAFKSLAGHLVYGLTAGVVFSWLGAHRATAPAHARRAGPPTVGVQIHR
jgi:hypothetical protein